MINEVTWEPNNFCGPMGPYWIGLLRAVAFFSRDHFDQLCGANFMTTLIYFVAHVDFWLVQIIWFFEFLFKFICFLLMEVYYYTWF